MIVHDFNVERVTVVPTEADAPTFVDPDAVLTLPVTLQLLEPVARRDPQVVKPIHRIELPEPAKGRSENVGRELLGPLTKQLFDDRRGRTRAHHGSVRQRRYY